MFAEAGGVKIKNTPLSLDILCNWVIVSKQISPEDEVVFEDVEHRGKLHVACVYDTAARCLCVWADVIDSTCEKITTRWPRARSFSSSRSRIWSLPEAATMRSSVARLPGENFVWCYGKLKCLDETVLRGQRRFEQRP